MWSESICSYIMATTISDTNRERDIAIDIVKFIAVLLILNSHAYVMYPKLQILATGGAIGDCLFLFCSGFTLFLGGQKPFGTYYKRRINRIYPSVFAAVVFTRIYIRDPQIVFWQLSGGEFVIAIMIYYIIIYYIRKHFVNNIPFVLLVVAIVSILVYIFWFPYKYETSSQGLYGITTYYRWIPYFAAMLLGAYTGIKRKEMKYNSIRDFTMLVLCVCIFYSIQFVSKLYRPVGSFHIVTILPLMGIAIYLYKYIYVGICTRGICHNINN